jgi:ankyrin repeat protein
VNALIAAGSDVNAVDKVTCTDYASVFACQLMMLLTSTSWQNESTALMMASAKGFIKVVEALIAAGADVNAVNKV